MIKLWSGKGLASLSTLLPGSPAGSPRRSQPAAHNHSKARNRPTGTNGSRTALNALLCTAATTVAAAAIAASVHYQTPTGPLAPPAALAHVPTARQAIASVRPQGKRHRFADALNLNRLYEDLSGLHPIRSLGRPLAALGNPLRGIATWYGDVLQGHKTASGETFDDHLLTAAHKTLPLGTVVRVTDVHTMRSVVVRINDRGVLAPGRIIDLSSAAASQLGILRAGIASVRLEVLHAPSQG